MIYLIDDSNLEQLSATYVYDEKYKGILCVVDNVADYKRTFVSLPADAECVMIHRTFGGTNVYKENLSQATDDGVNTPLVIFSAGDADVIFDEQDDRCILGIKKKVFYERLRDFLNDYLQNKVVNLRVLAYGKNYHTVLVRRWALDILRKVSGVKGVISESDLGAITRDGSLKKLIDASAPAIGVSYDELVNEKLIDQPVMAADFVGKINKIVDSFNQYGKNIYTWE